jgi:hypothetical protein
MTRREFGRLAVAGLPAAAFIENPLFNSVFAQGKPNSKFGGVQIGVITYSYRSMADQSAEATLKYVLESGVSAIELMDTPVELFLGRPAPVARAGGAGAAGGGRRGGAEAPAGPTPYEQLMAGTMPSCTPGQGRRGGGGGGRGGAQSTPEELAAQQQEADALRKWRTSVSLEKVKALRKMYNDAGVTMYAYKPDGCRRICRQQTLSSTTSLRSRQRSARPRYIWNCRPARMPWRWRSAWRSSPRSTRCSLDSIRTGKAA